MNLSALKKKVRARQTTFGSWITLGHPAIAEIMVQAGFDWLVIDMEHSAITLPEAQTLIQVIELSGIAPLVRVTSHNPDLIKRVLDAGAHGIIVPMVNSAEEAHSIVQSAKYPPQGTRGVGFGRASGYGFKFADYVSRINREVLIIAQIEHVNAVECAEDIFQVEGIDGFMVGPYDLSGSMGIPGRLNDPKMKRAYQAIRKAAQKSQICPGVHIVQPDPTDVRRRIAEGYRFIALGLDTLYLGGACRDVLTQVKR